MNDTPLPGNIAGLVQAADGHLESTARGRAFQNACRILLSLDRPDLEDAGVVPPGLCGRSEWTHFLGDPLAFLSELPADKFAALWQAIEERQPLTSLLDGGAHAPAS
jgi:hypothetical protein